MLRATICILSAIYFFQFSVIKSIELASFKIEFIEGKIEYPEWLVIIAILIVWTVTAIDLFSRFNARQLERLHAEADPSAASHNIKAGWPLTSPDHEQRVVYLWIQSALTTVTFAIFYLVPFMVGLVAMIHFLLKLAGVLA